MLPYIIIYINHIASVTINNNNNNNNSNNIIISLFWTFLHSFVTLYITLYLSPS